MFNYFRKFFVVMLLLCNNITFGMTDVHIPPLRCGMDRDYDENFFRGYGDFPGASELLPRVEPLFSGDPSNNPSAYVFLCMDQEIYDRLYIGIITVSEPDDDAFKGIKNINEYSEENKGNLIWSGEIVFLKPYTVVDVPQWRKFWREYNDFWFSYRFPKRYLPNVYEGNEEEDHLDHNDPDLPLMKSNPYRNEENRFDIGFEFESNECRRLKLNTVAIPYNERPFYSTEWGAYGNPFRKYPVQRESLLLNSYMDSWKVLPVTQIIRDSIACFKLDGGMTVTEVIKKISEVFAFEPDVKADSFGKEVPHYNKNNNNGLTLVTKFLKSLGFYKGKIPDDRWFRSYEEDEVKKMIFEGIEDDHKENSYIIVHKKNARAEVLDEFGKEYLDKGLDGQGNIAGQFVMIPFSEASNYPYKNILEKISKDGKYGQSSLHKSEGQYIHNPQGGSPLAGLPRHEPKAEDNTNNGSDNNSGLDDVDNDKDQSDVKTQSNIEESQNNDDDNEKHIDKEPTRADFHGGHNGDDFPIVPFHNNCRVDYEENVNGICTTISCRIG